MPSNRNSNNLVVPEAQQGLKPTKNGSCKRSRNSKL